MSSIEGSRGPFNDSRRAQSLYDFGKQFVAYLIGG